MRPDFFIGEWLECPECGFLCDAPFRREGSVGDAPELVLGSMLADSATVPEGEWRAQVKAKCPECSRQIQAEAIFQMRKLVGFKGIEKD